MKSEVLEANTTIETLVLPIVIASGNDLRLYCEYNHFMFNHVIGLFSHAMM